MSTPLRLSIIMVLLLATTAFGLIAYNMNLPKQAPVRIQSSRGTAHEREKVVIINPRAASGEQEQSVG